MKKYSLLLLLFSFSIISFGQIKEKQTIDSLFIEWDKPEVPGCALGIIQDGKLIYSKGYGIGDLEHDIQITPTSVFYTGSVSKQFVTFSILLLEEQGKLDLDDKIQKYLPDFPEYDTPLTIRHFIHHTSGVRDYLTLMYLKGRNYLDNSDVDEVYELIKKQKELNFSPGEKYLYSNSCYFMLAMIVEKAANQSLKEFSHENIFQPLGMKNTLFYDDNTDLIKNRVFSYYKKRDEDGFINLIMRFDLVGSGGVYSSIEDLFLWDQNFYINKLGKGGQEIIHRMHEEGLLNNGESSGYAFALNNGTYRGLKTVSHGGALAGYRAQLMRFPEENFSIIILANRGDANTTRMSYQVADIFLKENFTNDEVENQGKRDNNKPEFVHLKTKELESFAGHYWNDAGSYTRKIYVKNDTLRYFRSETNESNLVPLSKNKFKMVNVGEDVMVKFDENKQGDHTMSFIANGGKPIIFREYEPKTYTSEELVDFVGVYYSKELNVNYTLELENNLLVLNMNETKISALNSIMANLFSNDEYGIFHFKTDKYGKVSDFRLDAGRVTNLKFEKK
ncbi:serine hydrolase domain-containing protein [Psychroserpens jangbogonensis]|uniref:serine hydrolase domain-containing protein n=1 Tax=Psychroserpens jangbogonensis TaxID=1484460 RepID=UPI0006899E3A|nr:serine hydrolase [Psychroserpens jangbogonensis]